MSEPIKRLGEILPEVMETIRQRTRMNKKPGRHNERVWAAIGDYVKSKRCA